MAGLGSGADVERGKRGNEAARLVADVMAGLERLGGRVGGARD